VPVPEGADGAPPAGIADREIAPGAAPKLAGSIDAKNLRCFVVAGYGGDAHLFGNGTGYRVTLDGKPVSTRHSVGMVATTAVASLAATPGPTEKAFVDELWNTPTPSGEQRYYDGLLYLMSLMHCSGNFRIVEGRG